MATIATQNTSGEASKKRQRTEGAEEEDIKEEESPDLWLKDGSIIIRTISKDSPPTHTLYKVHKYILALHCSVFAALFEGPQAAFAIGSEHHDGIPIMDLPDDAEDVHDFLTALYFPKETQRHTTVMSPVRDGEWKMFPYSYFGVLRLAAKYDAAEIRDLLVPVLKASFPAVFEDWHHLQAVIIAADIPESPGEDYLLESVQFIRLAEACNVPDVLPVVLYELSCLFDDMDPEANFYHESFSSAMPSELTSDHLVKLMIGKAQIRSRVSRAFNVDEAEPSNCRVPASCDHCLRIWWGLMRSDGFNNVDPFTWIQSLFDSFDDEWMKKVCDSCQQQTKEYLITTRKEVWRELPRFFGLADAVSPNWGKAEAS
ncbi:hypothetical protein BV25DRAFT_1833470 [Artomyces pyxidatus]|uniref:Uncharacterized protein n=1 Tax=Artomyces pyxidatus TaxID=48021 RepID=A0ACB8SFC3_9AGAM|nr:hypothetical protein BV25DRAFT_1833470 [Artomyces pyxidatus]